jgi:hypothetical protein
VLHRFLAPAICDEGLGQAETKHLVFRLSRHERFEVLRP